VINQQGRSFTHGFEIYLEKATLLFDFAVIGDQGVTAMPLTVLDQRGKVVRPKLGSGDPIDSFTAELSEAVGAIRGGKPSPLLNGELARDALILGQRQTQSVQKGKKINV
jgi:predicted dehydrogenase